MRFAVIAAAVSLTACATAARATLIDRFEAIGLSPKMATCMVDDLDDRLSDDDMRDLARYTVGLSRADTPGKAIDQLLEFDNPRAVAAIGRAAFACVTGFDR
jgi:cytochrome c553